MLYKNHEVLEAHLRIIEKEPKKHNFSGVLKELSQEIESSNDEKRQQQQQESTIELNDNDQRLFFREEFSDGVEAEKNKTNENNSCSNSQNKVQEGERIEQTNENKQTNNKKIESDKLIDYEAFDEFASSSNLLLPSQLLMDDSLFNQNEMMPGSNVDLLGSLMPSAMQSKDLLSSSSSPALTKENTTSLNKNPSKKSNDISKWFQLFSDLDPLNQQKEVRDANENMHAA